MLCSEWNEHLILWVLNLISMLMPLLVNEMSVTANEQQSNSETDIHTRALAKQKWAKSENAMELIWMRWKCDTAVWTRASLVL